MITRIECCNVMKEFQAKHYSGEFSSNIVQSFINNISFPKTLDELYWFATEHNGMFNVENVLYDEVTTWTSPKWAKIGDIVFFMHSKTAKSTITKLRTQLYSGKDSIPKKKFNLLMDWINRGLDLYSKYGGKIFAIGRVIGAPEYIPDTDDYEDSSVYHWGSRIYSEIELFVLEKPIHISEFNDFIFVSRQSGITPVFGKEFIRLKEIISLKNKTPEYFAKSIATPLPLTKINSENWLEITEDYRRSFMLESQFRSYYVDYLLGTISDRKTIYKECRCVKPNNPNTFADNVIYINGKFVTVEVKLSIHAEPNIKGQVEQYCDTDEIYIDSKHNVKITPKQIYNKNVIVIDTEDIYIFNVEDYELKHISSLNDLTSVSDLKKLKEDIIMELVQL